MNDTPRSGTGLSLAPQAQAFRERLLHEGFAEPVIVRREPDGFLDQHSHPFTAKALILEGDILLTVAGRDSLYRPGEVFMLAADTPHAERYGASGVVYLVGRK